jgi:hypothetical protein
MAAMCGAGTWQDDSAQRWSYEDARPIQTIWSSRLQGRNQQGSADFQHASPKSSSNNFAFRSDL